MQNTPNMKTDFTPAERAENGRKGGIASGLARRSRRTLRELAVAALGKPATDGNAHTAGEAITAALSSRAQQGDTDAARLLAEMAGAVKA